MFFKPKKIILNAYTCRSDVYENSRPEKASNFFPEWWKQTPKEFKSPNQISPLPTIKRCYGFLEQFQHGFMLPMWSDFALEIMPNGALRWEFSDRKSEAAPHMAEQRGAYLAPEKYLHMKLVSPWTFSCAEDIHWQFIQPVWNFDQPDNLIIPSGIIEFKYQHGVNVNMFFPDRHLAGVRTIPWGQPLYHIIPISERPIELRHHLVTVEEWMRLNDSHAGLSFSKSYVNHKKATKAIEAKGKCPFHRSL